MIVKYVFCKCDNRNKNNENSNLQKPVPADNVMKQFKKQIPKNNDILKTQDMSQ